MAIPVSVVLDRTPYGTGPLDLTSLVDGNSLTWSSVMPGGFASCSFQLDGDFRQLVKQVPYLSTLRVIGDSGRVLFEGQIEDLSPVLTEQTVGLKVGAYGLQNTLKECTAHAIYSKRDVTFVRRSPTLVVPNPAMEVATGQINQADLTMTGLAYTGNGQTTAAGSAFSDWMILAPGSLTFTRIAFTYDKAGSANLAAQLFSGIEPSYTTLLNNASTQTGSVQNLAVGTPGDTMFLFRGAWSAPTATANTDYIRYYNIRVLGTATNEDVTGGFYGDTLIRSLLNSYAPGIGQGVIESGSDFTIDHLDVTIRRTVYDVLTEITQYYKREWAVWEDALLHWRTPNLAEPGWTIPITILSSLDLDASVQNSNKTSVVLYTDAGSGLPNESYVASTDRRNPYVLNGRTKDQINSQSFPMTANTASQLASQILQDLGFGPVPAAGTISLPGNTIVNHTSQSAKKAWEIRAGDNVTIPELPLADVFTQDGRGETTFHVVSAEASGSTGLVTLSLDSYGSKRSDVLLARLAAVTAALGG